MLALRGCVELASQARVRANLPPVAALAAQDARDRPGSSNAAAIGQAMQTRMRNGIAGSGAGASAAAVSRPAATSTVTAAKAQTTSERRTAETVLSPAWRSAEGRRCSRDLRGPKRAGWHATCRRREPPATLGVRQSPAGVRVRIRSCSEAQLST
jgi:hypothetical protein